MHLKAGMTPGSQMLACPFCDCDCVHPTGVRVYPVHGCVAYDITHAGLSAQPSEARMKQRGISIVLQLACEWGHQWEEELRFHKGTTWVTTLLTHETPEGVEPDLPQVIWRD